MKFVVNTKPLVDSINLSVINQNVSKYYHMSCVIQITATRHNLTVNVEASRICSQVVLKGMGDEDGPVTTFVDSLMFKQLISTFESSTTVLEFTEGGLILHSGKSKFNLGSMFSEDVEEISLKKPVTSSGSAKPLSINKEDWRFVKDHMLYALAMSYVNPIYTYLYVGGDGDVIAGDFEMGLFVHSNKSNLNKTCIIPDTIVNLLTSLPDGSQIAEDGEDYIITYSSDSFSYISQFTPYYEEDEEVGSYRADTILDIMDTNEEGSLILDTAVINKFLGQAALLSHDTEDKINLTVENGVLTLKDANVECHQDVNGFSTGSYSMNFLTELLKSVLSKYTGDTIYIKPSISEDTGEYTGMLFWDDTLCTVLSSLDD